MGFDRWNDFAPGFTGLTVVGATNYSGRFRRTGKMAQVQVRFSAATSVAAVAGTTYLELPIAAKGLSGMGVMTNLTTNIGVGLCHVDVVNSRLWLPSQAASISVFTLFAEYEVI